MARTLALLSALTCIPVAHGQDESVRFFEERIRPVLATRCQACHNEELKTSGLSLATREATLAGGTRGVAIVPGSPADSLIVAALEGDGALSMPPTGALSDEEVQAFRTWIADGAAWGADSGDPVPAAALWSLQPIQPSSPPDVSAPDWVRNPIDSFVLAKLDEAGLRPSPEADRRTLIRRASLDLTGLLPSPEEVRRFVEDTEAGAYARLVERLLKSPHYGERWGRHWLDIARYADTNGYSIDGPRSIWRYRDWVIKALNDNLPFDRFVIEQVAGDLLPDPTESQLIATGFHRNTMINQEGGIDFEQYRVEAVVDRVRTTGSAFLGLTLACARCHDHKFDPISQQEFFQVFSFFNNVDELGGNLEETVGRSRMMDPVLELSDPETLARRDAGRQEIERMEAELTELKRSIEAAWDTRFPPSDIDGIEIAREIVAVPPEDRSSVQESVLSRVLYEHAEEYRQKSDELKERRKQLPEVEWTMVMRDLPEPRESYIHIQGDFTRKGERVEPGTLAVLPPLPPGAPRNRLGLARWLVSENNPMTPRVTMNRIWQRYFGVGIVETENDFGSQGTLPSHPALLDWLASEFVQSGWDLKAMHRLILNSATYRQSSAYRADAAAEDPSNRLLARQNRMRLEAEVIRDVSLSASGLLTPTIGGPSVYPPQPAGAGQFTQVDRKWKADEGPDRYRRGMYTYFIRSAAHPGLVLFDAPIAQESVTRRNRSNTPLQALTLLNDESQTEFAAALGERVRSLAKGREARIRQAFEVCLSRPPRPAEHERFSEFLGRMEDSFQSAPEAVAASGFDSPAAAAWAAAARVMINLDEFVTRQ